MVDKDELSKFQEVYLETRDQRLAMAHIPAERKLLFMSSPEAAEAIRAAEAKLRAIDAEKANPTPAQLIGDYGAMVSVLVDAAKDEGDTRAAKMALEAIQWQLSKLNPEVYGEKADSGTKVAVQVNTAPVVIRTADGKETPVTFNVGGDDDGA